MREKILAGIAILGVAVGGLVYDYYLSQPEAMASTVETKPVRIAPSALPKVRLTSFTGQKFTVNELKEPVILLSFWASWCAVCIAEMPDLINLVEEMDGKLALVNVSIDDTLPPAEKYQQILESKGMLTSSHIYWAWDENKEVSLNQFNVAKTPETIIVDPSRRMVEKIVGVYDWKDGKMKEYLQNL